MNRVRPSTAVSPAGTLDAAIQALCGAASTQSQAHIKPVHNHLSPRLVLEGGFLPEWVHPKPPYRAKHKTNFEHGLKCVTGQPDASELRILGGIKAKNLDVTVVHPSIGPVLGISAKSTGNAFRNLTNRMEEAVGDCTNLHLIYPGLVYGFLHVLRANREHEVTSRNDIALLAGGAVAEGIVRYHDILLRLTGRSNVRDEASLYEAVSMGLVDTAPAGASMMTAYPPTESPLHYDRFFPTLLSAYDQRFVYAAPALAARTARVEWDADSPAIKVAHDAGFVPRAA